MTLVGIAGVNGAKLNASLVGVAGVDRLSKGSLLGIAGIDSKGIHDKAVVGIAGNPGSTIRPLFASLTDKPKVPGKGLAERVQTGAWEHAVYFSDWTYLVCPDGKGGVRWRKGFEDMFSRKNRRMPLGLDSASFRIHTGAAPKWACFELYLKAIDLIDPDFYAHMDVIGDQFASLVNYDRMVATGYGGDRLVPVWQIGPSYDKSRSAVANAMLVQHDPIFCYYASRHRMVMIGGMVKGPCPREHRHLYAGTLSNLFPDNRLWLLGQASHMVINGLGMLGKLDKVSVDGSWWIHHARTEAMAVMHGGLIKSIKLEGTGMQSFFLLGERMLCNIRSGLAAYHDLVPFPKAEDEIKIINDPRAHLMEKLEAGDSLRAKLAPEIPTFAHMLGIA